MAETLGLVASVIQVAGAGLKLSQTLYQYADGVATADRRIKDIAKEIQLTSFVIEELGDIFKQDETSKLMSENAVKTANETMKECSSVFAEIDATLKKSKKNTLGRLMLPFRDSKIELLRTHIDKLKSTLLLLMQVLSHAHQIASKKLDREAEAKQKAQIQELIELKKQSTRNYEKSLRRFSLNDESTLNDHDLMSDRESLNDSTSDSTFEAAAIGSIINPETLETCVQHIRILLEDIETLQQALTSQVDGSDHSERHQSLIGSYFRARSHLDSVLFKGSNGLNTSTSSIKTPEDHSLVQSTAGSVQGTRKAPIKIRDTSGKTYNLPFQSCSTWDGIHDRTKRIYEDRGGIWQHRIAKGFDFLDSDGHTILPEDWSEIVEPGMIVSIQFRHRRTSGRTFQRKPQYEDVYIESGSEMMQPGSRQEIRADSIEQPNSEELQAEVDATIAIMHENIKKISERGEKLDSLPGSTQNLTLSAEGFQRSARRVDKWPSAYWNHLVSWITSPVANPSVATDVIRNSETTVVSEEYCGHLEGAQTTIQAQSSSPVARLEHEKPLDEPALSSQDQDNTLGGTLREEILPDSASGARDSIRNQTAEKTNSYHPPRPVAVERQLASGGQQLSAHRSKTTLGTPRLPPPPPPVRPRASLTSATYIPDGASFGPGVGLPPRLTTSENNTVPAGATSKSEAITNTKRPEPTKDGLSLPHTETGRPRRSAVLIFGDVEAEPNSYAPTITLTPEAKDKRRLERKYIKEMSGRVSQFDQVDELLKEWTTVF